MRLEERIRSGLHATAEHIPEDTISRGVAPTERKRPRGIRVGVAAVLAVLVLFSPLVFLNGSDQATTPEQISATPEPDVDDASFVHRGRFW